MTGQQLKWGAPWQWVGELFFAAAARRDDEPPVIERIEHPAILMDDSGYCVSAAFSGALTQIVEQADFSIRQEGEALMGQAVLWRRWTTGSNPSDALGQIEDAWRTVGEDHLGFRGARRELNVVHHTIRGRDRNFAEAPIQLVCWAG